MRGPVVVAVDAVDVRGDRARAPHRHHGRATPRVQAPDGTAARRCARRAAAGSRRKLEQCRELELRALRSMRLRHQRLRFGSGLLVLAGIAERADLRERLLAIGVRQHRRGPGVIAGRLVEESPRDVGRALHRERIDVCERADVRREPCTPPVEARAPHRRCLVVATHGGQLGRERVGIAAEHGLRVLERAVRERRAGRRERRLIAARRTGDTSARTPSPTSLHAASRRCAATLR